MPSDERNEGGRVVRGLKWTASVVVAIAVLWNAGTWAGDTRYVTKSEFQAYIAAQEIAVRREAAVSRKGTLEDKVFELDLVPDEQKTSVQRALANRAKTQLQEVQTQIMKDSKP